MWRSRASGQSQAAEPSDFEGDLVAVLVVAEPEDESAEVEEEELPESLDTEGVLVAPEPLWESLSEFLSELWLLRREPLRESLRESLR